MWSYLGLSFRGNVRFVHQVVLYSININAAIDFSGVILLGLSKNTALLKVHIYTQYSQIFGFHKVLIYV